MRRPTAAVGSAVFFLVAPGTVVGLIPWLLTGWQVREPVPYWAPMRVLGVILLVAGLIVLVQAFARFVVERSEEHTSELQSRRYLHSFPTRRSSDLCADQQPQSAARCSSWWLQAP